MIERNGQGDEEKTAPDPARDSTKPSGQDVGPPGERVDDEVGSDDGKTTKRQE